MLHLNYGGKAVKNNLNNFDWKKYAGIGLIVFIFSLPVMLWRSSKIGKILYIILFLTMVVRASTYAIDKLSNAYFNVTGIFETRQQIHPVLWEIKKLKILIAEEKEVISGLKKQRAEIFDKVLDKVLNEANALISEKREKILNNLSEIETHVSFIKESERQAVKKSIMEMVEQVKLGGHSIDEAEIRNRLESILDAKKLLTDEERKRLFKYLEEIGFKVITIENNAQKIYARTYGIISADMVSYIPVDRNYQEE